MAAGTLARMPFKVTRERVQGPGVLDMKAGVVMALSAVEVLQELGFCEGRSLCSSMATRKLGARFA